jgi:biotin operon repressor
MSSTSHDTTAKKRVLEILRILIVNVVHYTRKKLAELYGISVDIISKDFESIKNAGFDLNTDQNYRYYLTAEKSIINKALEHSTTEVEQKRIINKLETLTNLPRIGNIVFIKPYIAKTGILF